MHTLHMHLHQTQGTQQKAKDVEVVFVTKKVTEANSNNGDLAILHVSLSLPQRRWQSLGTIEESRASLAEDESMSDEEEDIINFVESQPARGNQLPSRVQTILWSLHHLPMIKRLPLPRKRL